ncbi:MAG: hypothetical protein JRJ69_13045 [Deltaproteobacteria bacterium]|nr:hypothetical protein [Deltaproteobacteria bacterium]MBW1910925.1 hypothetical protein [Deltaproteobacteria bacterium]MBW2170330.1 hypothetical protein [Deltaproteobacteria bacterium]
MRESFEEILFKQDRPCRASIAAGRNIHRARKLMISLTDHHDDFWLMIFD